VGKQWSQHPIFERVRSAAVRFSKYSLELKPADVLLTGSSTRTTRIPAADALLMNLRAIINNGSVVETSWLLHIARATFNASLFFPGRRLTLSVFFSVAKNLVRNLFTYTLLRLSEHFQG
jgi:hypothetical protein